MGNILVGSEDLESVRLVASSKMQWLLDFPVIVLDSRNVGA